MQEKVESSSLYRVLYGIIGILVVTIVLALGFIIVRDLVVEPTNVEGGVTMLFEQDDSFDGIDVYNPPRHVPDFTLTDHTGAPLSISDLGDKPILLTFGFTNCPDICPLTLNEFRKIREALGDDGDSVHYLFISVDGERDTSDVLANYFRVRRLDDFMLGMTGEEVDIRRIGVDYNLRFEYGVADDSGRYNVDHTAGSFLLDANGDYVAKFAFGTSHEVIVRYLADLLAGNVLGS